jgi:hypothetical protein
MIQEALDMACEQLLDEISIKVMLEKDSVGWKSYSPLTDEERRMYNAMVSPLVNPHPFFSNELEQTGATHLSSVGGAPIFYYPEFTTHPTEGEDGGAPVPILSRGAGSPVGAVTSRRGGHCCPSPRRRGGGGGWTTRSTRPLRTGRLTLQLGDASLSTVATEVVTVVATVASDGPSHPTVGGMLPSPRLPLRW